MPSAYSTASSSKTILCAHQGLEYYWGIIILYITHMKPCNILHYSHGATYCERAGIGVLAYNLQVLCFFSQNRLFPSDRAHTHTHTNDCLCAKILVTSLRGGSPPSFGLIIISATQRTLIHVRFCVFFSQLKMT